MKYEKTVVYVPKDSMISCNKGFLQKSPITENFYVVKKLKVLGNNCFEVIGEKEEVNINY